MAVQTDENIVTDIREIKKFIEASASKPRGDAQRSRSVMTFDQHRSDQWPVERLKRIADTYAPFHSAEEVNMWAGGGLGRRSPAISGIGPYLCKMAGMAAKAVNHTQTLQILQNSCGFENNYGTENFCREFSVNLATSPTVTKGLNGRQVTKAALAEGSGQTGGYTIPPQFMTELLTIAAEDGFIEKKAKVIPMNTRTVQWPMLDITTAQARGTSPYFGGILGQWQPEAASINESEPAFRSTDWTAWDLVLYTVASNQLLADNGIGLDALLTQLFGAAITWYKEFAYLQGTGSGSTMPLGVINAPATIAVSRNTASKFFFSDAATMLSKLQIRSWGDACWIMHQSLVPQILQMVDHVTSGVADTGGHLVWLNMVGNGVDGPLAQKMPQAFLGGLPLYFTEKLPQLGTKGDVLLVDWSRYVIGMRLDLQIDVSPHFLFRNNQLAYRIIARVDGKPWLNSAITDQSGFTASPFVALNV